MLEPKADREVLSERQGDQFAPLSRQEPGWDPAHVVQICASGSVASQAGLLQFHGFTLNHLKETGKSKVNR